MTKQLSIAGKVITFKNVEKKSLPQFKAQLKQNGIVISDERAESVYAVVCGTSK